MRKGKMMKTMNRLWAMLSAVLFAVGLSVVAAQPANAVQPAAVTAVIVLDADGSGLPVAEAATDWSKNTGISVVTGDCTGTKCVHFKVVNFACGYGAPVGGCAYRVADGSCQVEVSVWVWDKSWSRLDELVTKHEAGHCIWSYGGISQSYHLPEVPHALMSATHSSSPSVKESTLYVTDRKFTQGLVF